MKSIFKNIMRRAAVLGIALCAVGSSIHAYELSIETDNKGNDNKNLMLIKGVGKISKDGTFSYNNNVTPLDSIEINQIALPYNTGNIPHDIVILEGNDTIFFSPEVTKSLIKMESFKLSTKSNYTVKHGDNSWEIKFVDAPVAAAPEPTANPNANNEGNMNENVETTPDSGGSDTPVWAIVLIIFACICVVVIVYLCLLLKKYKEQQAAAPAEDGNGVSATAAKTDNTKGGIAQDSVIEAGKMINDQMLPATSDKSLDSDKKLEELQNEIEELKRRDVSNRAAITEKEKINITISKIISELGISTNKTGADAAGEVLDKIISLKPKQAATSETDKVLAKMSEKDELKRIVEKAKDECKGRGNSVDILLKVVNMLPSKLRQAGNTTSQPPSSEITQEQMNDVNVRRQMTNWAIEQIEMYGNGKILLNVNKNGTPNQVFTIIANKLKTAISPSEEDKEKIVDEVILDGALTDSQKKVLVRKLIDRLNNKISAEENQIDRKSGVDEFLTLIAEKMQQEQPKDIEEAQNQVRSVHLASVNELFESDIEKFDKDSLHTAYKKAVVKILNEKISGLDAADLEEALKKLISISRSQQELDGLEKEYDAATLQELVEAIKQKVKENLFEETSKSCEKKVSKLLPDKHFESIQQLVNALIKSAEGAKEDLQMVSGALEEKIALKDKEYKSAGDETNLLQLIEYYTKLVDNQEVDLKGVIRKNTETITKLEKDSSEKSAEIDQLREKNNVLMSESEMLAESLHTGAKKISEAMKTLLIACSDANEDQCIDIEDRLYHDLTESVMRLSAFKVEKDATPAQTRSQIQKLLEEEITQDNSPINTVCRYYAYSRLAFMTDKAREYGIIFNRKNISELYNAIETLYVQFGINLDIPVLFVMSFEEGDFENVTGKVFGDLDNLCQNSKNHFDNIDSQHKPSNVIVDVVNIGYTIDGKKGRAASVLTY